MKRMKMKIKIETSFTPLISACNDLPAGVTLISQQAIEARYHGDESVATVVLTFGSGVLASVIGAWIYDKIKKVKDNRKFWIKINEKIARQIDEHSITEMVQREIEVSRKEKIIEKGLHRMGKKNRSRQN
jgi:hypothetical protein